MTTSAIALLKFTVLALNENNGQIISHHVKAATAQNAFATAAAMDDALTFVATLPGWLTEDGSIEYPGSALVGAGTILEQPEVFGAPTLEVTADTIENVLSEYSLRVTDTQGKSFATMAAELVDEVNKCEAIRAAMDCDTVAAMNQALFDHLKDQLVNLGVLEF